MLRTCFFWQGGGVFVGSGGEATLIDSNVYSNIASGVRCSHLCDFPSPRWNVTCAHGWQFGGGLAIYGTATLTNTNVYANQAGDVCSLLNIP